MFSLGKNRLNLHVKIFSSVLTLKKRWSFTTKEVLFYYKRPPLLYLPLRGKFLPHRSFCFPMRFSQAYRPHVQGRKQRNRGKVCRFDNGKGFCPKVSARQPRFHCINSGESMETNTPHYFNPCLRVLSLRSLHSLSFSLFRKRCPLTIFKVFNFMACEKSVGRRKVKFLRVFERLINYCVLDCCEYIEDCLKKDGVFTVGKRRLFPKKRRVRGAKTSFFESKDFVFF